jgi:hypothetical protein
MILLSKHKNSVALDSLEKAARKIEKAINEYNKIATDPHRTTEPNRGYYFKAINIYNKIKLQHNLYLNN